ncbi:MAG: arginine--tRNA ligase [Parvularculaceae bacterium]
MFVTMSVAALKQDYEDLDVEFDLWKGEADADALIAEMVADLEGKGLVENSDGAKIIRVARVDDKKTVPPIILVNSEGAVGYHATDMATILDRRRSLDPARMLYVVDNRQALHFEQVFRAVDLAGYFEESKLEHLGFGTMNGKEGKPFKTREGGVLKLRDLINMVEERAAARLAENGFSDGYGAAQAKDVASKVGVAALKFADLSNPRTTDYIFDLDRFMAFEGKTGPYLLYASVRVRSVIEKAKGAGVFETGPISITAPEERDLALMMLQFGEAVKLAVDKRAPHFLCEHAFSLAQAFSRFYAACRIVDESDRAARASRLALLEAAGRQLDCVIGLLGMSAPQKM